MEAYTGAVEQVTLYGVPGEDVLHRDLNRLQQKYDGLRIGAVKDTGPPCDIRFEVAALDGQYADHVANRVKQELHRLECRYRAEW